MNGVAMTIAVPALAGQALAATASPAPVYPPALTGLRGAHPGAFETAHAVAWEGRKFARPDALTDDLYDLIVVGAGLSGLAAAADFRDRAGRPVSILLLDNHDDFGGHAKRNEFTVDGRTLIGYGGSQSIDSPASYSPQARAMLGSLGVDPAKFYDWYDADFYAQRKMGSAIHYDVATFGKSVLANAPFADWSQSPSGDQLKRALKAAPLSKETKAAFERLGANVKDTLPGKSHDEKIAYLRSISYEDFLRKDAGATEEMIALMRRTPHGLWGVGWDVLSALEGARFGMPGTTGLGVDDALADEHDTGEPYIFHFPDGNATLARLLVRKLIPDAIPGASVEDVVLARADYSKLDRAGSPTRIRLNATAVDIRHSQTRRSADVVYVKDGQTQRVRGRHVIMAGYMAMAPYILSEMPTEQAEAVRFFTKVPLVYINVALRNWRAFEKAGVNRIYSPNGLIESFALDFPVSIGDYRFSGSPDEPILLHLQYVPTAPGAGLNEKDQHRAGRAKLYAMTFDDFETAIVDQLTEMMGPYGFDAERDIAGITVNRWPHGYAYEYNELFDGPDRSPTNGPHLQARAEIGRISIANSDSSAYAYVNGAFDAAVRAVTEQLAVAD